MKKDSCIVVTGAAGFIGSCLVGFLNEQGYSNLVLVDEFDRADKLPNLEDKQFTQKIEREEFFRWLVNEKPVIDFIFHIGARTDTTEFNYSIHERLNVEYSQKIWNWCSEQQVPLVYASSAATYGSGELGYDDDQQVIFNLKPLNAYGVSKNEFDKWAVQQEKHPPHWAGLKFFNVYGPNEFHKGRMASVIWHSFNQVRQSGAVRLFKSHRADFKDGQQLRDFIYVKDVLKVCYWFMQQFQTGSGKNAKPASGLYNLGTGKARSFEDLARATFAGMDKKPEIQYIDMPEDIRDKYQYFTEANMQKLARAGYHDEFWTLEKGVEDYVRNYLVKKKYF